MSKKYISQINNDNFVFPNNRLAEYDVEIIHDLKEDSVNGVITGFSPLTYSGSPANIGISFTYQWYLNNAEPFISTTNGKLNILSVHMQSPTKAYFKPWICVGAVQDNNVNLTYKTDIFTIWVTPQMMGQTSFNSGTYYFEVRFLGKRAVFPVSTSKTLTLPTSTPTPTPTIGTPTPTPTGGPTFTPTPTPTSTSPCYCYEIVVTGTTGGEGGTIATLDYNDCYGTRTSRAFTVGPGTYKQCIQTVGGVVQYFEGTNGIDTSYLTIPGVGNCRTGYVCTGYTPATTATPTPTPTATGVPPTYTPTPTPTATGVPPTYTPTPTPTATGVPPTYTPTPTPTATGLPPTYTPTPTATPIPPTYTYVVNCSGTLQGYLLGNYSAGTQITVSSVCYVATTTTTSPTGTQIFGAQTVGTCCPTPTPTPTPAPVSIGIYTGATFGSASAACTDGTSMSGAIFIPSGTLLNNGDTVYSNSLCTTPFSGNNQYYRLFYFGNFYSAQISTGGVVSGLVACSSLPTPTPTPTPTATPTPTISLYNYYSVTRYNCPTCNSPVTGLFARTTSPTSLTNGNYYNNGDGYVYLVNFGTAGPSYTIDLDGSASSGTNCSGTCGV